MLKRMVEEMPCIQEHISQKHEECYNKEEKSELSKDKNDCIEALKLPEFTHDELKHKVDTLRIIYIKYNE